MNANDILKYNIKLCHSVTKMYLEDVSEEEMFVRAVDGSNHLAWQLGHLIGSDAQMLAMVGGNPPALPDGFAEAHGKETINDDDRSHFKTKAEYLDLMNQLNEAAIAFIDGLTEEDFAKPGPEEMRAYMPTVGTVLLMLGSHEMMHTGQFAAIRRKLGKPIVI